MKRLQKIITPFILVTCVLSLASCGREEAASLAKPPSSPSAAAAKPSPGTSETTPATTSTEASPAKPSSTAAVLKLAFEPKTITRGSPCLFVATSSDSLSSLSGEWLGKKVFFNSDQTRKTWYGLGGVNLETTLGNKVIVLKGLTASGQVVTLNTRVEVEARKAGNIRVPPEYTDPDDDDRARIAREAELKSDKFKTLSPHFLWTGSFIQPVADDIRMTAIFGGTRRFNRGPVKVHKGIDYGAPAGTPIKAINSGRVILAKNLFYDGNMVTIDHGQGLLSLYLHLSKMNVREGDMVKAGQEIGLSGSTGRASGPHLHLQVKWEGFDIDPPKLMELKLPTNLVKAN